MSLPAGMDMESSSSSDPSENNNKNPDWANQQQRYVVETSESYSSLNKKTVNKTIPKKEKKELPLWKQISLDS